MSNKWKKRLFFTLTILFSLVIPSVAIAVKFKLIQDFAGAPSYTKISIIAALAICFIFLINLKRIFQYLRTAPFSIYKCVINGLFKFIPLACLMLILINIETWIVNIKFAYYWFFWGNAIALFVFEPLWLHYAEEYRYDIDYKKRRIREENGVK